MAIIATTAEALVTTNIGKSDIGRALTIVSSNATFD
jgi:hypothetical protein